MTAIVLATTIYCGYLAASLVWLLWPQPQVTAVMPPATASSTAKNGVNIAAIKAVKLFGDAAAVVQEQPKQEVTSDAPETRLSINLTGVVAATDDNSAGLAIIESQGSQETYGIDDVIKGTRAKLAKVLPDRAILDVNGRFETLMLDGVSFTKTVSMPVPASKEPEKSGPSRQQAKQSVNVTADPELKAELQQKREEVLADPGKLTDYIRVSPVRNQGQLQGYKLSPGKDPLLFKQMGLENNDIAVAINGYQLTDMKQAMAALQELRSSTEAAITVNRNGQLIDVQFSLQ
ncbi:MULTISPECIES: type II secretion system protein GspC [unclassified Pseudoalteromonas]|uniref:type II secretion system protein GspC n=1 Tax=unclassified Pseudoalteromonas TaxID=194690 RepID=UPI001F2395E2|nr:MULTISPECIES: type II secretion system protein GspC [unclassified Pseudoalteromonas]